MCNKSLEEGWLPESQRHASIKPIVKKEGLDATDVKNYRPISNLTYMSKLVERLVYIQLVEFLELNGLLPKFQSGFRKHHSTETAVLKVLSDILSATDRQCVTLLGLLDMSAAFDTVDHTILLQRLSSSFGMSGSVLSWLNSFLSGRTQQVIFNGNSSQSAPVTCGVPQGSILGPLMFLLYTADILLIAADHGLSMHCYADDGQLYVYEKTGMVGSLVLRVANCIAEIESWLSSNRLKLNADKTQFVWLGSWQQLNKFDIPTVNLGGNFVSVQSSVMDLGVLLDNKLTMKDHVDKICRSSFYQLRQLRTIRKSLPSDACQTLIHAFVTSRLDYCNSLLYGISSTLIKRLDSVFRCAARLVMRKMKFDHISSDMRDVLHWLPTRQRINYKLCLLVYNCIHGDAPIYLAEMLRPVSSVPSRGGLRSAAHGDFIVPRTKTVLFGPRSFAVAGPTLWNGLPAHIKDFANTKSVFKMKLKTFLFSQ
jgi:hypothetical protein